MAKTTKKTQNDKGMSALKGHWLWGALALCILLLIDLLTKVGAKVYFDTLGEANIVLIPNVLELTYIENPGMAFSMGKPDQQISGAERNTGSCRSPELQTAGHRTDTHDSSWFCCYTDGTAGNSHRKR